MRCRVHFGALALCRAMKLIDSASAAAIHPGISLGVQLVAAVLLLIVMVLVHGVGIVAATRLLRLEDRSLRAHHVDFKAFGLLTVIALWLFALHLFEVTGFALFYYSVGAIEEFEAALYFSVSAYATLGQPNLDFPKDWRILGAMEGLVGFLLIGWSTAIFFADMNKLLRERISGRDGPER